MTTGGAIDRRAFLAVAGGVVGAVAADLAQPGAREQGVGARAAWAAERPPVGIPFMHGYDAPAIKAWSPETDPYAKYFRSRVPLARRIPSFRPTQANPDLDDRPRLMTLANDYMEAENFVLAHRYGYTFEAYALRFWQYLDMMGSWHGLPVYGDAGKDEPRFGTVNLPNPAWTDAAHRNGVKSLGCWFWPRPEDFAEFVERRPDGSFPVAEKLVEMAVYFGFDGYFINQEGQVTPEQAEALHEMLGFMARIAPEGFHIQWYDALTTDGRVRYQNEFNEVNAPWVVADGTRVCSSIFLNYWWSEERLQRSHDYAVALGLDPYEVVFAGTEAGLNNFSQPYDPRWIFPEAGEPRTSWAFLGTEFPWRIAPGEDRSTVEAQRPVYVLERQWWSGPKQDPSRTGRSLPPTGEDKHNPERWDGVAHTIVEKSVIGSYPFVTRFNAGTGLRFFIEGTLVGRRPWFNIGIQDILPTWQWWVRSADDGGPATNLSVDYDYEVAYDGGTSLLVAGSLAAGEPVELRLFKTWLPVHADAEAALTVLTGNPADVEQAGETASDTEPPGTGHAARLRLGLTFADQPDQVTWLDLPDSASAGWRRVSVPLARYAGRTIAAISLGFQSPVAVEDYALRVGELRLTRRSDAVGRPPRPPRGFVVEQAHVVDDVATVFLAWQLASENVWYYDIFRRLPGGAREWLGRVFDEVYVVPGIERRPGEVDTTLELVAVSPSGVPSRPARARFSWR
ncbi:endo-beta-N-acetylglucosaminidase [Thermasporomyces composti]|jgi:endo-beta-N-acetylglucosaminidase D|uniref:Endo-beta-N-acetylglucosaminidase D n=1 Tax=Thermasporomyces composti TaxID=696763 RepID=A0A3D9V4I3_THECX|nr:endo-beta-N-acetylglucosaminidase [Thermasporomyces composti]REF35603.1 endo-beta-N-acetylglucosaminidase D [Thermasporomyces composti]